MKENNIIVALLSILASSPVITLLIKNYLDKRNNKKNKVDLKNHHFFSEMDYMIKIVIPRLAVKNNPLKTKLLRDFLRIKFNVTNSFIRNITNEVLDGKVLSANEYSEIIVNIVNAYEKEAILNDIPEIFVQKFSEWHLHKIDIMREMLLKICQSNTHSNIYEIHSAFLDLFIVILHLMISDAEGAILEMNGELEKVLKEQKCKKNS